MIPMPRFPPRGPLGRLFPRFDGTIKALRLLSPLPPHFVSFAWRYHGNAPVSLSSPRTHGRCRAWGFSPGTPTGNSSVETTGSPKFLGNLNSRLHMFFDPGRPNAPNLSGTLAWPSLGKRRRRQRYNCFRGSLAWLSGLRPTFHDVGCPSPRKTRFQALVKLSWTGFHPQGSDNRFQSHFMFNILLFQAFLARPRFGRMNDQNEALRPIYLPTSR